MTTIAIRFGSCPTACRAAGSRTELPSIHSAVITCSLVRSQLNPAPEIEIAAGVLPQLGRRRSLHAKIQFDATEVASRSTTAMTRSRRASADNRSAIRAAKAKAEDLPQIAAEHPVAALLPPPVCVRTCLRFMHLRDGCSSDRVSEAWKQDFDWLAECAFNLPFGDLGRERRKAILQCLQRERHIVSDKIRPRGEHLSELDVRRSEVFQRTGQPRSCRKTLRLGIARTQQATDHSHRQGHAG